MPNHRAKAVPQRITQHRLMFLLFVLDLHVCVAHSLDNWSIPGLAESSQRVLFALHALYNRISRLTRLASAAVTVRCYCRNSNQHPFQQLLCLLDRAL